MSRQQPPQWHMYAALAAGILASFALGRWSAGNRGSSASSRYRPPHRKVFVLAVGITCADMEPRDKFLAAWGAIAEYVKGAEPRLISYELSISDSDPLRLLVYERYVAKADYTGTHRSSPAFRAFKEATQGLALRIEGHSYLESNLGFV